MSTKFFTCAFLCMLLFRPVTVLNSQTLISKETIETLRAKEAENRRLREKVKMNEEEINILLAKYIETKSGEKPKKTPIYKRIFESKAEKAKRHEIIPVPMKKIDISIQVPDTVSPVIVPVVRKEPFLKRIFKIFKRKK